MPKRVNPKGRHATHYVTQYNAFFDPMYNSLMDKGMSQKEAKARTESAAKAKFGYLYAGARKKDIASVDRKAATHRRTKQGQKVNKYLKGAKFE